MKRGCCVCSPFWRVLGNCLSTVVFQCFFGDCRRPPLLLLGFGPFSLRLASFVSLCASGFAVVRCLLAFMPWATGCPSGFMLRALGHAYLQ